MNVTLSEALFVDPSRRSQRLDTLFIQNRLIRFVQLPPAMDVLQVLRVRYGENGEGRPRRTKGMGCHTNLRVRIAVTT
jgi:hypothetical protein